MYVYFQCLSQVRSPVVIRYAVHAADQVWTVWSYSLWYAVYGVLYLLHVWCLQESYKQALPAGPDEHQLQYCYSFRFSQRPQGGARQAAEKYEQNVKLVGCFSTVEQFWSYYCYMKRPGDLPSPCDIHLFKVGISPIWEVCTYIGTWMYMDHLLVHAATVVCMYVYISIYVGVTMNIKLWLLLCHHWYAVALHAWFSVLGSVGPWLSIPTHVLTSVHWSHRLYI